MIDIIILLAFFVVFYAGFWAGQTFGTMANMWQAMKDLIKGKL